MKSNNSYIYDPKSNIEKERLDERDKRTSTRRSFALDEVDFSGIRNILDVGCGSGVTGFDLLTRSNNASLIGIDIEPEILQEAKNKSPEGFFCNFIAGNGAVLPMVGTTFDLVTCQYLLQHATQPIQILEEMRRVSRKNAKILVFEWDDGVNFSYPPLPEELDKVFRAKIRLVHIKGGDRHIGRKLYHLLHAAGWRNMGVFAHPLKKVQSRSS